MSLLTAMGQMFSYIALAFGIFFFVFACKYYVAILLALFGGKVRNNNTETIQSYPKEKYDDKLRTPSVSEKYNRFHLAERNEPFVSIHLPFYNEKNVAQRIVQACIKLDYTNYEILVVDDSRDETIQILKKLNRRKGPPTIKFIHRKDRQGFKGGALAEALNHMDPRTEYILVFDADFIPPSDIIKQFLWYFKYPKNDYEGDVEGNHRFAGRVIEHFNYHNDQKHVEKEMLQRVNEWYEIRKIAAVQGYQLHHLNKNENWITKGVRAEFSGSYMIERVAEEFFGAMKMISGSVFMLRADIVKKLGWSTSITEDWDLTLRLYISGYKVVYTPLIQAPAEIPTTIRRLVRQRMRWAEGHTFAVKKYFWDILESRMLTLNEKLEFLYFAPYYLQSLIFLVGSFCWMLAEILHQHPNFWTEIFGWCLLMSNFLALPLMSLTGLFLERNTREDLTGIFSFIAFSYIITPFQAYAAVKGLLEKDEGGWIRTLKTGTITDKILRVQMRKIFSWVLPARDKHKKSKERREKSKKNPTKVAILFLFLMSSIIIWITTTALSIPKEVVPENTALSFQYMEDTIKVNGIETNHILTHPEYTKLNPYHNVVNCTTSDKGWHKAWAFYLYGPLNSDYHLKGRILLNIYLYATDETKTEVSLRIREVHTNGKIRNRVFLRFKNVEIESSPQTKPLCLESNVINSLKFQKGNTIQLEIGLKSDRVEKTTYYLEYDSKKKHSRIELPGIVLPETILPLLIIAPLIPILISKIKNICE